MSVLELQTLVKTVAALNGRVEGALDLAAIIKSGAVPTASLQAYVVPLGITSRGKPSASTGAYIQSIDDGFGVIIVMRKSGDVTGKKISDDLDDLVRDIINAVCGRGPEEAIGVFELKNGRLISLKAGTAFYQLTFTLQSQIRINS